MSAPEVRAPSTRALAAMSESQVRREPWPDLGSIDRGAYDAETLRSAAHQFWRRAREEYGSIHEFAALGHALTRIRAPIEVLGAVARLVTDEVRHAELCARAAEALSDERWPWPPPSPPFDAPPADPAAIPRWAADAVMCSCCIGETVSRPLYEALATVTTEPALEGVFRQILRDEHLHARFGWETLAWLLEALDASDRGWLEGRIARRLAQFERTCAAGLALDELVGVELAIAPPPADDPPNLGHLTARQYATIFYATIEAEVLPGFRAVGLDADRAWRERSVSR